MFDIGFFELVLVAIVALLVLGPERLPHAVRMTGAFVGKLRRMMINVREEFEREVNMAEMQQRLKEQMEQSGLDEARKSVEEMRQQVNEARQDVQNVIAPPPAAAAPQAESVTPADNPEAVAESAIPAPQPPAPTEPETPKHS